MCSVKVFPEENIPSCSSVRLEILCITLVQVKYTKSVELGKHDSVSKKFRNVSTIGEDSTVLIFLAPCVS